MSIEYFSLVKNITKGKPMSSIKNYSYDLEEYVIQAIENGFTSFDDVFAFVNTNMKTNERDVLAVLESFHEEPEFPELNGTYL